MKKYYFRIIELIVFLLLINSNGYSQYITGVEFFVDTDPGIGNATPIYATDGSFDDSIEHIFLNNLSVSNLNKGWHQLFIRGKDNANQWGPLKSIAFNIVKQNDPLVKDYTINSVEYFIDIDPGQGNAIQVPAADGSFNSAIEYISLNNLPVSNLTSGWHHLYIRGKDNNNQWGPTKSIAFNVDKKNEQETITDPTIESVEFFFDIDPGYGNGFPLSAIDGATDSAIEFVHWENNHNLELGYHTFNIRGKDSNGHWGPTKSISFNVEEEMQGGDTTFTISDAEYFIDTDPGEGNGIPINADDGMFDSIVEYVNLENINIQNLSEGTHYIYVRGKRNDGKWGPEKGFMFTIESLAKRIIEHNCNNQIIIQTFFTSPDNFIIREKIPYGLVPYNINENGIWNETEQLISWNVPSTNSTFDVSYQLSGDVQEYTLNGLIIINQAHYKIDGNQTSTITHCPINFVSDILPPAQIGRLYENPVEIQGGTYPYVFKILQNNSLPPGLSIHLTTGIIQGFPTQSGRYSFTVKVADTLNNENTHAYSIEVTDPLVCMTNSFPIITINSNSSLKLNAKGGKPPYTFSKISGELPHGISLTYDGKLSGNFLKAGNYEFTVKITDALSNKVVHNFVIDVSDPSVHGTASRTFNSLECTNQVSIQTSFSFPVGGFTLTEYIPDGLFPSEISQGGRWDYLERCIIWFDQSNLINPEFSYQVSGYAQQYSINGKLVTKDMSSVITGENIFELSTCPLNFISNYLPPGQINVSYETQLAMEGGIPPYRFKVLSGIMPTGLQLHETNGSISGIPTKAGAYTFSIVCEGQNNKSVKREFSIEVTQKLTFLTQYQLPNATVNTDMIIPIRASGGKTPYTFSFENNIFPENLQLNPNGMLTGIALKADEYAFTVMVSDFNKNNTQKTFSLLICEPLIIKTQRLYDCITGQSCEMTLHATGGFGEYQWEIYSGRLPSGLTFNSSSGDISGVTHQPVFNTFVMKVIDDDNRMAFKDFTFQVSHSLQFTSLNLPKALKNENYSEIIRITGGIAPFTYDFKGRMPDGLTFDNTSGRIYGQSSIGGTANIFMTVMDNSWPSPQKISQYMTIETTSFLTILTSSVIPRGRWGNEINPVILKAGGGLSPYTWNVTKGRLPSGISLNNATGILSGISVEQGNFVLSIQVTDAYSNQTEKEFIWHITDKLTITTDRLPDAAENAMYNFTLQAKGGVPPYQWRLKNTDLPDGLFLKNSTGMLYGEPVSQSSRSIVLEAYDSDNPPQVVEKSFHLEIIPKALYIFTPELPNCLLSQPYLTEIKALLGKPPYSWRLETGQLPSGLHLVHSPDQLSIEGTPTQIGENSFTILVSDNNTPPNYAKKMFTINIFGNIAITTNHLSQAQKGKTYHTILSAEGGNPPYTWRILQGSLPSGLTLNEITGIISGTVNDSIYDSEEFRIQVIDSGSPKSIDEKWLTIYVSDALHIITEIIPDAIQFHRYITTLDVVGGIKPYLFKVSNGALPYGLQLDELWGIISGFPKTYGEFPFSVQLSDSRMPPYFSTYKYVIKVSQGTPPVLVSGDLNADESLEISDAIIALQVLTQCRGIPVFMDADIYQDEHIDMIDVLMIMQELSK